MSDLPETPSWEMKLRYNTAQRFCGNYKPVEFTSDEARAIWDEMRRLIELAADLDECSVCEHARAYHKFDRVIRQTFCLHCFGDKDLHEFNLKEDE